ncbi:MAG TPA: hypothetical protein VGK78_07465 [Nocardioides sp.]|uniref:hypothetical protein n=1 Tax=Nocardioides sp. TaxID=35761 RepID=UPI002F3E9523
MSPDYVHRTGAPPGFKPVHLLVGVVVFVAWFAVLGFVLTHGRDHTSSVDVYSELPSGFTGALEAQGVTYQGLSPVDNGTQQQALSHLPALGNDNGGQPLVFRTSFTVAKKGGRPGPATPALMVVIPDPQGSDVHVEFVDPTTFKPLETVEYGASSPGTSSSSPTTSSAPSG